MSKPKNILQVDYFYFNKYNNEKLIQKLKPVPPNITCMMYIRNNVRYISPSSTGRKRGGGAHSEPRLPNFCFSFRKTWGDDSGSQLSSQKFEESVVKS